MANSSSPAVILFRVESYRLEEPAAWVLAWLAKETELLGRFTVFDGGTCRSRSLLRAVE